MYSIDSKLSIRRFFQLFLLISVILPMMILGGIGLFISSGILKDELTLSNKRQVSLIADNIEQHLENPFHILQIAGEQLNSTKSLSTEVRMGIIKSFADSYDILTSIQVADSEGKIVLVYPQDDFFLGSDVSGHEYFRVVERTKNFFWAPSYMSEQSDQPVITLSLPHDDGVITAVLSLEKITNTFEQNQLSGSDIIYYVTDQKGVYISHSEKEKVLLQEYDPLFIQFKQDEFIDDSIIEYNKTLYLPSIEIIETSGWMVVLMQPLRSLNEPVIAMAYSLIILTFIIIIISLLSGNMLRNSFSNPLNELIFSTRGISEGLYDITVPQVNFFELTQLAESIGKMSEEIRKREDALRKARTYLSNIIDSMPSMLIGITPDLIVTQWNRQAEIVSGIKLDDVIGKTLEEIMPRLSDEIPLIKRSIAEKKRHVVSQRVYFNKSEKIIEDITVYPLIADDVSGAVIRIDDVTDKVHMEEIIIQNEKMLSVGGLAAGMAHEINNPLAGMIQTANVLSRRLGLNQNNSSNIRAAEEVSLSLDIMHQYLELRDIPNMINNINLSGKRISDIVNNMLSFVRNSEDLISSHEINQIIDQSLDLAVIDYNLKKKYDFKKIRIQKEYSSDLPKVLCEMTKIQQVFFNILQNGAHAMSESSDRDPCFILRTYFDSVMQMIVIEIEDNGPGMSETVQKRIFEPFYTTKPIGVGTGLGLSVSYFIITENQKGEMTVESRPGEGAKFIIKLPVGKEYLVI